MADHYIQHWLSKYFPVHTLILGYLPPYNKSTLLLKTNLVILLVKMSTFCFLLSILGIIFSSILVMIFLVTILDAVLFTLILVTSL